MKRMLGVLICLFLGVVALVPPSSAADAPAVVVGRIYDIEGDLLRYIPAENDWVAVVRDAPFGVEDTLFSGSQGMAELVAPNGSWIRVGNSTQIQFIALDTDLSEIDVAAGVARFYNKGSSTVVKATSPFGYVLAYPGSVFDFYVGENSVEVVPVMGTVSFVHTATNAKYDVAAGSPSILADQYQVSSGEGTVDPGWDQWNRARENFWATKARARGRSVNYLPPSLQDESYALEENGRWERVPYEGSSRWFWRPTTVAVGWSPFTMGRWTDWGGDQCWIPDEPFGYVTHHYGNWIYARSRWYWAPPVATVRVGLPLLNIGFFWYPGRVSWIHSGPYVGWVPLAPRETYYSHRNWGGPHVVVVNNVNITRININVRNYAYADHAIVVPQNNFYRVNNYRNVRVTSVSSATIINNYRAAPVINNTVINNYSTNNQRYNYTTAKVNEKPHSTVINRIQQNDTIIREGKKENAVVLEQQVKKLPEGRIDRQARIEQPKMTNRIVPAADVNKPKSEVKFEQREIGGPARGGPQVSPAGAGRPAQQPTEPSQPGKQQERVAPARPGQQPQPVRPPQQPRPERVAPARPGQPEQARPERVAPARPGQQPQPVQPPEQARPEHVAPAKPSQPPQPEQARPEHVAPARPGQPEQARPERVAPPKPQQPVQPEQARPERVAPARPSQPPQPSRVGQPAPRPAEHEAPTKQALPPRAPQPAPPSPTPAAQPPAKAVPPPPSPKQPPAVEAPRPVPVAPARPTPPPRVAPPQQPTARPESVTPPKPAGPSEAKPERATPTKPGEHNRPQDEPGQQERPR
jgi:hypothetical protein